MVVVIASGKGGTGKTTIATSLAKVLERRGHAVQLLDADVEEPNCHLFCDMDIEHLTPVRVSYPIASAGACNGCGVCSSLCQFGAILPMNQGILVFPELCHSCGGCMLICPTHAIIEGVRDIGTVSEGRLDGIRFAQGKLNVGEARAVPVIAELKHRIDPAAFVLIDAPPGTSCPVVESVKGSDFVCLVTEPTPFGLHDLKLAVQATKRLSLRVGVVINRVGLGDDRVHRYCEEEHLPILAEIPNDRRLAEAYARGQIVSETVPDLLPVFEHLASAVESQVQ